MCVSVCFREGSEGGSECVFVRVYAFLCVCMCLCLCVCMCVGGKYSFKLDASKL